MKGSIRAKGTCVACGSGYRGADVRCSCGRQPERGIFIDLHWSSAKGGRIKIYSDRDGVPFKAVAYAQSALEAIRYEIRHGLFDATRYVARSLAELRFEVYAKRWLKAREQEAARGEITQSTLATNRQRLDGYLIPALRGRDIREIRALHVIELAASLEAGGEGRKKASAGTRAYCMRLLRKILRDAHRWGDLEKVPPIVGTADPEPQHEQITLSEQEAILARIDAWHRPIIELLCYHPIRPGEACALQWRDLDLEAGTMQIRRTMSLRKARDSRKSGHPYVLPLHAVSVDALRQLRAEVPDTHPTAFVFLTPGRGMLPADPAALAEALRHRRKHPYSPSVLDRIWDRACEIVTGRHVTLYESTRHLIASEAVSRGIDIGTVSKALGHRQISTTMRSYARYRTEALRQVIDLRTPTVPGDRPQTVPRAKNGKPK